MVSMPPSVPQPVPAGTDDDMVPQPFPEDDGADIVPQPSPAGVDDDIVPQSLPEDDEPLMTWAGFAGSNCITPSCASTSAMRLVIRSFKAYRKYICTK